MADRSGDFIDFLVACGALTFGDFTAKSGRPTPYFVNAGQVRTGSQIDRMGSFYANAVIDLVGHDVDVIFGPAYKGIPLAVTTAMNLHRDHGRDVGFCFDRKEVKDHGEGGTLVGHVPRDGDRVVIVEDVTTAGTSIRETVPKLRAVADVEVVGLVIGLDRQERGPAGSGTALSEVGAEFGLRTAALATITDVVADLRGRVIDGEVVLTEADARRIEAHLATYGPGQR